MFDQEKAQGATPLLIKEGNALAHAIRFLSADAVEKAKSGHPGMPLGMADVATVLFQKHLKFFAQEPKWSDRDRFILSCGHGSMLLYSLLYLTGYPDITIDHIKRFRQIDSPCAGHPEYGALLGIETTTGPLGQGIGNAVGMAISEAKLRAQGKANHYTYVMASDGDLMEGISHEACALAGHLRLNRLIILYDDNSVTIDGSTDLSYSDNVMKRFEAYGFHVQTIDGHDDDAIDHALTKAKQSLVPSLIQCRTLIGWGAPDKEGTCAVHGAPLGAETIQKMRARLNWPYAPFEIPEEVLQAWRQIGKQHEATFKESSTLDPRFRGDDNGEQHASIALSNIKGLPSKGESLATREASQIVLNTLTERLPHWIGGSADLTASTNTQTQWTEGLSSDNPDGRFIYFGVREHAMGAVLNGLSLHGTFRPYGGTYLVFSDYLRPALRLSALMHQPVVYVFTHDSIGLGEDGPTHQPIEHLTSLRAMPGLDVYRPCDAIETAECWLLALAEQHKPSALILTRQKVPVLRIMETENRSARGGYVLQETSDQPQFVFCATGSEVALACAIATVLYEKHSITSRVVSMPCIERFLKQPHDYIAQTLGDSQRIGIEAASGIDWGRLLRPNDMFFGMTTFGTSAPYQDVYRHFGLTTESIIEAVLK